MITLTKASTSGTGLLPTEKVAVGGAAGALATIVVWVADLAGLDVPAGVAAAFATLLGVAAAYLKTDATG